MSEDLSGNLAYFDAVSCAVTRETGSYVDGIWTPTSPAPATLTVNLAWWPARGEDLKRLAEGQISGEMLGLAASGQLKAASSANATKADMVAIPGKGTYQVEHVEDWSGQGGFWFAVARRVAL